MVSMALFDRFLFAFTIGSHIILVTMSISLILLISIAEFIGIRRNNDYYLTMAERLTRVFVVSFGVGTASGIVMAVELVNLFPGFMTLLANSGAITLFYAEVFTFFLETFALVIYVYYRNAFRGKYSHWITSVFIAAGTLGSAVFITMVNSWMNSPNGFDISLYLSTGTVASVNPWAPFLTPTTLAQIAHVISSTIFTGSMLIGAYFAWKYIHTDDTAERIFFKSGIKLSASLSIVFIVLSGLTGSHEMGALLVNQPLKYAALDLNFLPGSGLPERLFGTLVNGQFTGGLEIPNVQSLLASFETGITNLPGLTQFPQADWPPLWVHSTFDIMVTGGLLLGLFMFVYFVLWATKRNPHERRLMLYGQGVLGAFSLVVYEVGWITDEVGRQPWIVYNVMKVSAAANYTDSLLVPGFFIVAFYIFLIPATFYFFSRVFNSRPLKAELTGGHSEGGVNY